VIKTNTGPLHCENTHSQPARFLKTCKLPVEVTSLYFTNYYCTLPTLPFLKHQANNWHKQMNHSTASIWCNSSLYWQQFPRWPITFSTFSTKEEEGPLKDSKDNTQTRFKNLWNLKTFTYIWKYEKISNFISYNWTKIVHIHLKCEGVVYNLKRIFWKQEKLQTGE